MYVHENNHPHSKALHCTLTKPVQLLKGYSVKKGGPSITLQINLYELDAGSHGYLLLVHTLMIRPIKL